MINILLLASCVLSPLVAATVSPPPPSVSRTPAGKKKTVADYNKEIESLTNLRDYYSAKVVRYRDRASRYQLQPDNLEEAKRLNKEADKLDVVVQQIDKEIKELQEQRDAIVS